MEILNPTAGAELSGPVEVEADVSGGGQQVEVSFFIDGERVSTDTDPPYNYLWMRLGSLGRFTATVQATAVKANGESASDQVEVTVNRPEPGIDLLSVGEPETDFQVTLQIEESVFIDRITTTNSSGLIHDLVLDAEFSRFDRIVLPSQSDTFTYMRSSWEVKVYGETRSGFIVPFEKVILFTKF